MVSKSKRVLISVNQWLSSWDRASWVDRPKPPGNFFIGSIPLSILRNLSGVRPRTIEDRKNATPDAGYQRSHDKDRLAKIARYIEYGFPLSTEPNLPASSHSELINPGWLPTAILVNVLAQGESRPKGGRSVEVQEKHLVRFLKIEDQTILEFPTDLILDTDHDLAPLEIIDGQHRLLSVDYIQGALDNYEVPVVFFDNLDLSWQAYLFWVINVEPKKINTSLAFDLYPELRDQDWLERGEAIRIYQEHRSQELAEILWRHPTSPWHDRIELFGKRVGGHVSNAAVIRSLMATFVRPWAKHLESDENGRLGGLFGSIDRGGKKYVINWKRPHQAAFLLLCWEGVKKVAQASQAPWVQHLKKKKEDPFSGSYTLFATDQGFRAICFTFNALTQLAYDKIGIVDLDTAMIDSEMTTENIENWLKKLRDRPLLIGFLEEVAAALIAGVDWRLSSTPGMDESEKAYQSQYRGSSGYSALNQSSLRATLNSNNETVSSASLKALKMMGWEKVE